MAASFAPRVSTAAMFTKPRARTRARWVDGARLSLSSDSTRTGPGDVPADSRVGTGREPVVERVGKT